MKNLIITMMPKNIQQTIDEFKNAFPVSHEYLGTTLTSIMSPSLVLKKLTTPLTDYAVLTFPMLKGLEGYLKLVLSEYGIVVSKDGFGEFFDYNSLKYRLNQDTKNIIKNVKIISLIEDIYDYYKNNRHGLFHIDNNVVTSRLISNKTEAENVISAIIGLIETSHNTIKKENTNIGTTI